MPAKRNPKKSRRPAPSVAEVTPPDLDALTVAPSAPVPPPTGTSPTVPARETPPPPPRTGPVVRGGGGSTAARGQSRRYAFRRS
ncbi:hypothetical protein [Micromonospora psammae]|uniref:hypothetical protein n=1 Tax=Micromonospora sp. CPCC 205556 TaxID=3122398 RepID=UPI002FF2C2B6